MRVTSPSQHGGEGTDYEEVWILTEESAILVIGPPSRRDLVFFPCMEAQF
jgi:hypothetical protein